MARSWGASPLPLGRGFVRGAHGRIPLPAPATAELLKGVPVVGVDSQVELVTPTGAVLLTSSAQRFGPMPPMKYHAIGYGAGGRETPSPNLLRVFLGEINGAGDETVESLVQLETNIDDLNPEIYEHVMAQLFAAGALDVSLIDIQMKKNRPGTLVQALCRPADADALRRILLRETTTLGIRQATVSRYSLPRRAATVETPYGTVRVKIAKLPDGTIKVSPEYEDCRRLAVAHNLPLLQVYHLAQSSAAALSVQG